MIVSFSGIDGSGKSTFAKELALYLSSKDIKAEYRHMIRDSFYHILLHKVIGRGSKGLKNNIEASLRNKNGGMGFLISKAMKKLALLLNLVYFNLRYMGYRNNKNRTIICDRYFYDDIVQMRFLNIAGERFIAFYTMLIKKPDMVFFIESDPVLAFQRKSEYDERYFIEKSRLYSEFYANVSHVRIPEGTIESGIALVKEKAKKAFNKP